MKSNSVYNRLEVTKKFAKGKIFESLSFSVILMNGYRMKEPHELVTITANAYAFIQQKEAVNNLNCTLF